MRYRDGKRSNPDRPWGGKRSNAGRPKRIPDGVKRVKQTIEITEEQAETARRIGGGNLTEGVRIALDRAKESE